jgi:hypothetical protein
MHDEPVPELVHLVEFIFTESSLEAIELLLERLREKFPEEVQPVLPIIPATGAEEKLEKLFNI